MNETLEQFIGRMEEVEQSEAWHVGPYSSGRDRFMFTIDGMIWFMETHIPHNWFKQSRTWYHADYAFQGKKLAQTAAKKYNAEIEECPYSEEDYYYLTFENFRDIARFLFDRKANNGKVLI